MSILELRNVDKSYGRDGERASVLKNVNLDMARGELVAILGFSGSGKTTLLSLIAGLIEPDRGTICFKEREIDGPGPDRSVVFQNYSLLPWLTVEANVQLAVDQVFPAWPRSRRRDHALKYVEMVRLGPAARKLPGQLSGGMRQRVSLARALAIEPDMLLLDEPLSALDALTRASLGDEIEQIWSTTRKTVLLITNDVDEAIFLADRIIPLTPGPDATLGPSFPVNLPRPRDRRALLRDPELKALRRGILDDLLRSRAVARAPAASRIARVDASLLEHAVVDWQPRPAPEPVGASP